MSDIKPRSDAEAVLSSVRRLVSETTGGGSGSGAAAQPEKLLLTPALRVDVGTEERNLPTRRTRVQTRTLTAERISLEQRIAELEKAVGDQGDWEPDGSEPDADEVPREFVWGDRARDAAERREAQGGFAREAETQETREEDAPVPFDRAMRMQPVAEPAPEPEPEPEPEAGPGFEADTGEDADEAPETVFHSERERTWPARTEEQEPEPVAEAPREAEEMPVLRLEPQPQPQPQPEPEPEPAAALPAQAQSVDLDERVIDEEMLRDVVSEIVRSELQGELGERITRNVRKLVRREIHRAIMTRDFNG